MKKKLLLILLVGAFAFIGLAGCGILEQECGFPGCTRNAALFKDYCESHQKTADLVDGITGIFK